MDNTIVKKDCENCSKQFVCQEMIAHIGLRAKKPVAEDCVYYESFKEKCDKI